MRCDEPLTGEDGTWVLYGSGGCSAYDAAKLRALGGVDEAYAPAYVEDLDLGYRAWARGWPSVYVAGALVEHQHRATTSRYYSEEQLATVLELNYLKFLARAVASPRVFRRLWRQALDRLDLRAASDSAARAALRGAARLALAGGPPRAPAIREESLLALTDGSVACFPDRRLPAYRLLWSPPRDCRWRRVMTNPARSCWFASPNWSCRPPTYWPAMWRSSRLAPTRLSMPPRSGRSASGG